MKTGCSVSRPNPFARAKNCGVNVASTPLTKEPYSAGSYVLPSLLQGGKAQPRWLREVFGGLAIVAPRVEHLSQAELKGGAAVVAEIRFRQQLPHAASRPPEAGCGESSPVGKRHCRNCRALPPVLWRRRSCDVGRTPAQFDLQDPPVARRPPRPAFLGPAGYCPGCCGPQRNPAFSSSARRQQATASSSFPWPCKTVPRLLCASAKSGFSSSARR